MNYHLNFRILLLFYQMGLVTPLVAIQTIMNMGVQWGSAPALDLLNNATQTNLEPAFLLPITGLGTTIKFIMAADSTLRRKRAMQMAIMLASSFSTACNSRCICKCCVWRLNRCSNCTYAGCVSHAWW